MKNSYNTRQLRALTFLAFLVPIMRIVPRFSAREAGSGAWCAPFIALPFILLYIYFLSAPLSGRNQGEGLGEMLLRSGGNVFGKAVLFITGLFALFYCGFVLRSGADRFISTIYTSGSPWPFVFIMLILALFAVFGPKKALVRTAKIFLPLLLLVLIAVLIFSFTTIDAGLLLPLSHGDIIPLLKAAFPILNVSVGMLAFSAFLETECEPEFHRTKSYILWFLPICLLISAIIAAIVGNYGAPLTAKLTNPFFTIIRDVSLFNTIERIEAFMVALWVFPDFIVTGLTMIVAQHSLRLCFGLNPNLGKGLKNGRWIILLDAAIIGAVALILPQDSAKMLKLSELYVPIAGLSLTALLYPLCFAVGKLRKR